MCNRRGATINVKKAPFLDYIEHATFIGLRLSVGLEAELAATCACGAGNHVGVCIDTFTRRTMHPSYSCAQCKACDATARLSVVV